MVWQSFASCGACGPNCSTCQRCGCYDGAQLTPYHHATLHQARVRRQTQAIVVVTAVLWVLLTRIAGTALMEEASDVEHPAEEKQRRLLGDPAAQTEKPTKSENLVRADLGVVTAKELAGE